MDMLLKERAAAEALGLSPRTLQKYRLVGGGPLFCRVSSRAIRYRPADLETWITERLRTSTSDTGA